LPTTRRLKSACPLLQGTPEYEVCAHCRNSCFEMQRVWRKCLRDGVVVALASDPPISRRIE